MSELVRHYIHKGRVQPYRCGASDGAGSTGALHVTCTVCLSLLNGGLEDQPPLHTPPAMNNDDGIFEFYDIHLDAGGDYSLEVVPQLSGNVEITMGDSLFTLSHLDRMDLVRALLHDFHYSPERGGPNGIDS